MTEKNYAPDAKEKKMMKKSVDKIPLPKVKEENKIHPISEDKKIEDVKKKSEDKKKKEYACVNVKGIPISTKMGAYICKFIKYKKIDDAIKYLEGTMKGKNVIPMKGEIAHRHGEFMAGRYPKNASKEFIILLKSLKSNAIQNGIEEPIITEAIANMGSKPLGRGGRIERKRTHLKLVAKEIKGANKKQ